MFEDFEVRKRDYVAFPVGSEGNFDAVRVMQETVAERLALKTKDYRFLLVSKDDKFLSISSWRMLNALRWGLADAGIKINDDGNFYQEKSGRVAENVTFSIKHLSKGEYEITVTAEYYKQETL